MSEVRSAFLATLRAGLREMPRHAVDEVVEDYAAHFEEGAAAGRSDAEVSAALGDPLALADELRVEMRISALEAGQSPRKALHVIGTVIAMGVINASLTVVFAPVLLLIALTALIAIAVAFGASIWILFVGSSLGLPGGIAATWLCSFGLFTGAISLAAFTALGVIGLASALGRYARFHYQLIPRTA